MDNNIFRNISVIEHTSQAIKPRRIYAKWNKDEDELLINLVSSVGPKWKFISRYFSKKSVLQIYNRYLKIDPTIKHGRFNKEEDEKITSLVELYGTNWTKIATIVKTRSAKQIRYRYLKHLSKKFRSNHAILSEINEKEELNNQIDFVNNFDLKGYNF